MKSFAPRAAADKTAAQPASKGPAMADNRVATTKQRQAQADIAASPRQQARQLQALGSPTPPRPNRTGLPDKLKAGVESLSGHSLDDVKVHYNSAKPAQLQAHAYAQGTDIHLGPGQEKHLPHEAWHVVQQKQGRVRATRQMRGIAINEEANLEREADIQGGYAAVIGVRHLPVETAAVEVAPNLLQHPTSHCTLGPKNSRNNNVIQSKRYSKKLSHKQEVSRSRLLEKRVQRQERYAEQEKRKRDQDSSFWGPWKKKVEEMKKDTLYSSEVKRYTTSNDKDSDKKKHEKRNLKEHWDEKVKLLLNNIDTLYGDNSSSARKALRESMEAPWPRKKGHTVMPSKIWNVVQEVFDARTVYHTQKFMLYPALAENMDDDKKMHPKLGAKTPDYFLTPGKATNDTPVGDAINLTAENTEKAIKQAINDVKGKVNIYSDVPVTVVVGAHENPELLSPESISQVYKGIAELKNLPSKVFIVSGSLSAQVYPYSA